MMKLTDKSINSLGNFIDKLENSIKVGLIDIASLEKGAEKMADVIKNQSPVKTGKGKNHVRHFVKIDGKTLKVVKVGFKDDGWEEWKGLYYNHYGFHNDRTNTYVDKHKGWFDRAYKSGKGEVLEIIKNGTSDRINELL